MSDGVSRDELAARLEAVEARADAKFERLLGEVKTANAELAGKIETASAKTLDKWTAIAIAVGLVALIYAMLAYGGDLFGLGISTQTVAKEAAEQAAALALKK